MAPACRRHDGNIVGPSFSQSLPSRSPQSSTSTPEWLETPITSGSSWTAIAMHLLDALPDATVDDLHPGLPARSGQHLDSAVVAVKARLAQQDPDWGVAHQTPSTEIAIEPQSP